MIPPRGRPGPAPPPASRAAPSTRGAAGPRLLQVRERGRLLGPQQGLVPRLRGTVLRGVHAPGDGLHVGGVQVPGLHRPARGRVQAGRDGARVARAVAAAQRGGGGAGHEERAEVRGESAAGGGRVRQRVKAVTRGPRGASGVCPCPPSRLRPGFY
ncbi:hypothetical protein PAHAL_7G122100 [Panicum hallii]|uniref:Uncharacterized protein n=1 Tax=Panicum hallii TaxID=206008 RepID=A0A2S3I6K3_9POAL|nr:hypothetical protein PAHAL_7G122100 [Panicum hallii]